MTLITGTSGNDTIRPGTSSSGVVGTVDNAGDSIVGGGGNDVLQGGDGNDTLVGGSGFDTFYGSAGTDSIDGGTNSLRDALNYAGLTNGGATVNITYNYSGSTGSVVKGGLGADTLSGNFTLVVTGAGNDTIIAGNPTNTAYLHFHDAGLGSNSINGGSNANNVVDYSAAAGAMTVNLAAGTATGPGITDTLTNVRAVQASGFNDTITGSSTGENDFFISGAGSHVITGGGGNDNRLSYQRDGTAIIANLATGQVSHNGATDTVSNIQRLAGTNFADSLVGSSGNDIFYGLGGNDTISGGGGVDRVVYSGYNTGGLGSAGVTVNLGLGTATDGFGDTDTLIGIRNVQGSDLDDTLTGTNVLSGAAGLSGYPSTGTTFFGTLGSDKLDGVLSLASVTANYSTLSGGITATFTDWDNAKVVKNAGGTDTLTHVDAITGTNSSDSLAGASVFAAVGTYSYVVTLAGGIGNDTINGFGSIQTRVDYSVATGAANINLATGIASDGQGGLDTLVNVVRVRGSNFNDTILGSSRNDYIETQLAGSHKIDGGGGTNTYRYTGLDAVLLDLGTVAASGGGYQGLVTKSNGLGDSLSRFNIGYGGDGDDTVYGTPVDDTLAGFAGNNTLDGRGGSNTLAYSTLFYGAAPTHGVTVNLNTGTATNPWDGTDTLSNLQSVIGTPYADSVLGAALSAGAAGYLRGMAGDDTLAAPTTGTVNAADYLQDIAGVVVDLGAGTATDGWGGHDTLVNLNAVRGSAFADSITGSALNDTLQGGAGNDTLVGGFGRDVALYNNIAAGNTITNNGNGSWTVVGPDGTDVLRGIEVLRFSDGDLPLGQATQKVDFNADAMSDVVWQNIGSGVVYSWQMNGPAIAGGGYVATLDASTWKLLAAADFTNSGNAGLLWQNATTGDLWAFGMNGNIVTGASYIGTLDPSAWKLLAAGDFNGDGYADALWQNTGSGLLYEWQVSLNGVYAQGGIAALDPAQWKFLASADYNGDGKADLLWQDSTTGDVWEWFMNGTSIAGAAYVARLDPTQWNFLASADFTGDGKGDLLFQQAGSGVVYELQMNGGSIIGGGYVATLDPAQWTLLKVGDFNGDGKADMLWRATGSGDVWDLQLDGTSITAAGYLGSVDPAAWKLLA